MNAVTVLGSVLIIAQIADKAGQKAEHIADRAGQTAVNIARMSRSGSAEEKEALEKTEKMAHAAALGSANGASDALKNRWWLLWPWELLWGPSSTSSGSGSGSGSAKSKA